MDSRNNKKPSTTENPSLKPEIPLAIHTGPQRTRHPPVYPKDYETYRGEMFHINRLGIIYILCSVLIGYVLIN